MKFSSGAASLLALALFVAPVLAEDAPLATDQPVTEQAAPAVDAAPPPDPAVEIAAPAIPDEIFALLSDTRAASELSDEELSQRAKKARRFSKEESLTQEVRDQLQGLAEASRSELEARKQAKEQAAQQEQQAAPPPAPEKQPVQEAAPAEAPAAIPDDVAALLNDGRSAADLDTEELKQRAKTARRFAKSDQLPQDVRDQLNTLAQDARIEITKRESSAQKDEQPPKQAEQPPKKPVVQEVTPVEVPAAAPVLPDEVTALLNDSRAVSDIDSEELKTRVKTARQLVKDDQLPQDIRDKLASIAKEARAELVKRDTQAQTQPAPAVEPPPADQPAIAQDVKPADEPPKVPAIVQEAPAVDVAQPAVAPPPPPAPTKAEVQALDNNAGDPALEKEARAYLDDTTPLENLSDEDLRSRLDGIRDVMAGNKLSRATEDAVRAKLKTERDILRVRIAQKEADAKAKEAAALQPAPDQKTGIADAAPVAPPPAPEPITDPAVQKALAALPPVPPAPPAPPPLPPIAVTNNNTTINNTVVNNIVIINAATPAPVVLRDRRPPEELQLAELQRRLQVYDDAQYDDEYDEEYRDYWRASVLRDREILRRRLIEERYRRQQQLTLGFSNDNLDIQINIDLTPDRPPPRYVFAAEVDDEELEEVLVAPPRIKTKQRYTVDEIAVQPRLRNTVSRIEIDTIRFGYNESFVREEQLQSLDGIAAIIERIVKKYPNEVFLIEGHTDAPGSGQYNARLSKLRAEAIKKALVSYYVIPARNLRTVGLGERFLKIPTAEAEPENRRVSISRITNLLSAN
jgi:outer membrane protein OmpA-like peptidoglycan-associated protein